MNLWVRTLRQLFIVTVALFFFSCEDESGLLGFKNPNKKFHVRYVDIPLNASSVFLSDSIITDLRPQIENGQQRFVDGLLVGEYVDNELGKVSASSFITIYPLAEAPLQSSVEFDSVTVQFRLNFSGYGFSGFSDQRFAVHEITGDTLSLFNGNRYYYNSPAPVYSPEALGHASVTVNYDTLKVKGAVLPTTQQDTLLATGRLSDDYGRRVFEAVRAGFTTNAQRKAFKAQIKGLALIPGNEPGILGLNVVTAGQLSRVTLHYHTLDANNAVVDTLIRTFGTEFASFTKIEADRSITELASLLPYQSADLPSGMRYVQSGSPVVTKLDLTPFYNFADTVENILINSAELVIENVGAPPGLDPHNSLLFRLMNNSSDQFLNNHIAADREAASEYFVITSTNEYYYFAATDGSVPATVSYDKSKSRFSGFMTLFAQSLFAKKNDEDGINENRLKYMALYPVSPPTARSVTRTAFNKDNVRLRIFYTRATTATP